MNNIPSGDFNSIVDSGMIFDFVKDVLKQSIFNGTNRNSPLHLPGNVHIGDPVLRITYRFLEPDENEN